MKSEENIINNTKEEITQKTDFEEHIIEAYKILSGFYLKISPEKNKNIKLCELEIQKAFNICKKNESININKNILDKISRIIYHNKINILFLLAKIFISLMSKQKLFEKNTDLKLIIYFMNVICNLNNLLEETYISYKLNFISQKFIEKILSEFNFEYDQVLAIKDLLEKNYLKMKTEKINTNSFEEMILSLNELLSNQESPIIQYKIIVDNFDYILGIINQIDLDERNNLENCIELGKILAYLLYNEKYVIFLKRQIGEGESTGVIKFFFNGEEENYLLSVIEGEKFYLECEKEIVEMREKIVELVVKYIDKYKTISNIFEFQYVLYVLSKRVFFLYYDKYKEKIENIISEIMINLCFYKTNTIEEIKIFIKEILNNNDEKYKNLKNLLLRKIDFIKMNPNFQLNTISKNRKENNSFKSIENISNEALFILEGDLKLGYFISKPIKNGENFVFYVELTSSYGILDFCAMIEEYNIKLTITDLTEEKVLLKNIEINLFTSPYKIFIFYTKPSILKFEFDNSYSWLRDKIIKYKVNIFYPQKSFYIERKILLLKYQEKLVKEKEQKDNKKNSGKNLFLIKFNGQNKAFNVLDVITNIKTCDKFLQNGYINIYNIYILKTQEKSFFYSFTDNKFEKFDLNQKNFEAKIKEKISLNNKSNINIINLYIINGDEKNIDNKNLLIEEILGFVPEMKYNENKILFFYQYYHQAQLIYFLYKSFLLKQNRDIVFLLNYAKDGGYQIAQYKNGEIKIGLDCFINKINKEQNLEKNIEIFCDEIKKYENKGKVDIIISESIDDINIFDYDKVSDMIKIKLNINDSEDNCFYIHKLDLESNKEVEKYSHIFYLD